MSASQFFSMGIKTNGTLWAWGRNEVGQLGDGTTTNRFVPVQIGTATNWESVSSGWYHTLALRTDGSLWVWGGNNDYGQLGNGTTTTLALPTQLAVTGCALGSETFLAQNNTLQLSPNPATTEVTLNYNGQDSVDAIVLYDISGKEVYTIAAIGNNAFMSTFSIAQLQSGMYVVTLKNKNKTVASSKLIKE